MAYDAEFKEQVFRDFLELSQQVEENLLKLENDPENGTYIKEVFRPFHTIKGNAGMIGEEDIQEISQVAESVLDEVRQGRRKLNTAMLEGALAAVDVIRSISEEQNAEPFKDQVGEITRTLHAILDEETESTVKDTNRSEREAVQIIDLPEDLCLQALKNINALSATVDRMKYHRSFSPLLDESFEAVLTTSLLFENNQALESINSCLKYLELYLGVLNTQNISYGDRAWGLLDKLRNDLQKNLYPLLLKNLSIVIQYLNPCNSVSELEQNIMEAGTAGALGFIVNLNLHAAPDREDILRLLELQRTWGDSLVFIQRDLGQKKYWRDIAFLLDEFPRVESSFWNGLVVLGDKREAVSV